MSINLKKGQRIDLTKTNPGLNDVTVGLGWDVNNSGSNEFDLDAIAFLLGADDKAKDEDVVYFNNLIHSSGAVTHQGDNRTGEGDGDDEKIDIVLNKVPESIQKIVICVAIYEVEQRKQNFGLVDNAYVRLVDKSNGNEVIRYDLTEDYSTDTAVIMGEIYRYKGEWKFAAKGQGIKTGLSGLVGLYNDSEESEAEEEDAKVEPPEVKAEVKAEAEEPQTGEMRDAIMCIMGIMPKATELDDLVDPDDCEDDVECQGGQRFWLPSAVDKWLFSAFFALVDDEDATIEDAHGNFTQAAYFGAEGPAQFPCDRNDILFCNAKPEDFEFSEDKDYYNAIADAIKKDNFGVEVGYRGGEELDELGYRKAETLCRFAGCMNSYGDADDFFNDARNEYSQYHDEEDFLNGMDDEGAGAIISKKEFKKIDPKTFMGFNLRYHRLKVDARFIKKDADDVERIDLKQFIAKGNADANTNWEYGDDSEMLYATAWMAMPKKAAKKEASKKELNAALLKVAHANFNIYSAKDVQSLIDAGANVNAKGDCGKRPLHGCQNPDVVKALIDAGANVKTKDDWGGMPLHDCKNADVAKLLISAGADVNAKTDRGRRPLHECHEADVVKVLLDAGADAKAKDVNGKTAMHTRYFSAEVAKLLIDAGADVNAKDSVGHAPLHVCRNADTAKLLIDAGADVKAADDNGNTPLHHVCNDVECTNALIGAGADVNAKDNEGKTPLFGCYTTTGAKALIDAGADVLVRDNNGQTAIYGCCNEDVASLLIDAGIDVNSKDDDGKTPLHSCCDMTDSVVRVLIDAGADVNAKDDEGKTPLHYGCNDSDVAQLLIDEGAEVNAEDDDGQTPLDLCEDDDIAELLIDAGAVRHDDEGMKHS